MYAIYLETIQRNKRLQKHHHPCHSQSKDADIKQYQAHDTTSATEEEGFTMNNSIPSLVDISPIKSPLSIPTMIAWHHSTESPGKETPLSTLSSFHRCRTFLSKRSLELKKRDSHCTADTALASYTDDDDDDDFVEDDNDDTDLVDDQVPHAPPLPCNMEDGDIDWDAYLSEDGMENFSLSDDEDGVEEEEEENDMYYESERGNDSNHVVSLHHVHQAASRRQSQYQPPLPLHCDDHALLMKMLTLENPTRHTSGLEIAIIPDPPPLPSSTASFAVSDPHVEIQPGWKVPLRGSEETLHAIETNFLTISHCNNCDQMLRCIQNVTHVLCSDCYVVHPLSNNDTQQEPIHDGTLIHQDNSMPCHHVQERNNNNNKVYSVGLGMNPDDFAACLEVLGKDSNDTCFSNHINPITTNNITTRTNSLELLHMALDFPLTERPF